MIKFKWVRIDRLVREEVHAQHELYASMVDRGLINPITVRAIPRTGSWWWLKPRLYQVIDGRQRVNAACRLGWRSIKAHVVSVTDAQLLEAQLIASTPYVKTPPALYAKAVRVLLDQGHTLEYIAGRIDRSVEWLEMLLKENPCSSTASSPPGQSKPTS